MNWIKFDYKVLVFFFFFLKKNAQNLYIVCVDLISNRIIKRSISITLYYCFLIDF